MKKPFTEVFIVPLAVTGLVVLLVGLVWHIVWSSTALVSLPARPVGVMGTECELTAVAPRAEARRALESAEAALRDAEAIMSVHLEASELSRFNAGDAGLYSLSPELVKVFLAGREFHKQTAGAFDVTCYRLVRLWKKCQAAGRRPTEAEIAEALGQVGSPRRLQFGPDGVRKLIDGVTVDLGGIAKGYGIDRAVDAMIKAGAAGGLVNVGGDLRCFGSDKKGRPWRVKIRHPFDAGPLEVLGTGRTCGTLLLTDAAVATSGDYHRHFEIDGKRYSHIIDPRTGAALPQGHASSVTVVSLSVDDAPPSATAADAWATALSVLGPAGLKLIDNRPGLEAMIITGSPKDHKIHMSKGFATLLELGAQIKLD